MPRFVGLGVFDAAALAARVWDGSAWASLAPRTLEASATYDPPSLASGASASTIISFTGAALGHFVAASCAMDLQGVALTARVSRRMPSLR